MSLIDRIGTFIEQRATGTFSSLALKVFALQFEAIPAYRRLCIGRGATPESISHWQEIPLVPTLAFQGDTDGAAEGVELSVAPPRLTFRSSGTTGAARRSVHRNPYPQLYHQAVEASFPQACLPRRPCPILRLVPDWQRQPDSSLAYMGHLVEERYGDPARGTSAMGDDGVEIDTADAWVAARATEGTPVLVMATAFALAWWIDARQQAVTPRALLPPGSIIFETGGFKGRTREVRRPELLQRIHHHLGVPENQVVREYGMTELSSQFYTRVRDGGDGDLFHTPHWTRVRILDPQTLAQQSPGEPGLVAVYDLANAGSVAAVLTEDLGIAEGEGFRLVGRAAGAQLRGCSLTVEELATGGFA